MKRLTNLSIIATLAVALAAVPLNAQSRSNGGGASRGGSSSSSSRGSSMSAPSRSSSSASTRSYSGGGPSRSYSAPQARPQSQARQSAPQTRQQSQARQSAPQARPQSQSQSRSYNAQPRQQAAPQTRSYGNTQGSRSQGQSARPQSQPQTRSNSGQVRGGQPQARPQGQGQVRAQSQSRSSRLQPGQTRSFSGSQPSRVVLRDQPGHGPQAQRIHPRHSEPMAWNRPVRFYDRGHHCFGHRVHYIPSRYTIIRHWGMDYYFLDGLYYRHHHGYYYVCRPPFGVFFDPVLDNIAYAACSFAYYNSVYNTFRTINENASTITAQNQTIAANNALIAQQNATIALNSERAVASQRAADDLGLVQSYASAADEYFYDDGIFFTKTADGKYKTIVPPAGALVQELPDDFDTITINGTEYYKVDDTVYRTNVVDGKVYFEVLGQLTGALAEQYSNYED